MHCFLEFRSHSTRRHGDLSSNVINKPFKPRVNKNESCELEKILLCNHSTLSTSWKDRVHLLLPSNNEHKYDTCICFCFFFYQVNSSNSDNSFLCVAIRQHVLPYDESKLSFEVVLLYFNV